MRVESLGWPVAECCAAGKLGAGGGAGRRRDVEVAGPSAWLTVVSGLKVTVLCGLGGFEVIGVGSSGVLSVDAEAIVWELALLNYL